VEGQGNFYDYGMRAYDPRIGRFPSVDPLAKQYPWYSPYQYAGNKPVWKRDIDGLEEEDAKEGKVEREELERNAEKIELSEILKTRTPEEQREYEKEEEEALRNPQRGIRQFLARANGYFGRGLEAYRSLVTEQGSRDVSTAINNFVGRQRGFALPMLKSSTAAEQEVEIDAALARATAGTVTGTGKPIVGQWLRGTQGNAGYVPESVAKQLRGQNFKSFDSFRQAFWKAVSNDPALLKQFSPSNQALILKGKAPFPVLDQQINGQETYQLHHIKPVQHGGDVYNVDNLMIVTPAYHQEVLSPTYHY
jgi:hypothetical protein